MSLFVVCAALGLPEYLDAWTQNAEGSHEYAIEEDAIAGVSAMVELEEGPWCDLGAGLGPGSSQYHLLNSQTAVQITPRYVHQMVPRMLRTPGSGPCRVSEHSGTDHFGD